MAWCRTFQKCILYNLLDNFFADSKSRAQELSNNVYICHIWRSNMGFRVGITLTPPPSVSWFSFNIPQQDRVNDFLPACKIYIKLDWIKRKESFEMM